MNHMNKKNEIVIKFKIDPQLKLTTKKLARLLNRDKDILKFLVNDKNFIVNLEHFFDQIKWLETKKAERYTLLATIVNLSPYMDYLDKWIDIKKFPDSETMIELVSTPICIMTVDMINDFIESDGQPAEEMNETEESEIFPRFKPDKFMISKINKSECLRDSLSCEDCKMREACDYYNEGHIEYMQAMVFTMLRWALWRMHGKAYFEGEKHWRKLNDKKYKEYMDLDVQCRD
jgi:hypothetical protein